MSGNQSLHAGFGIRIDVYLLWSAAAAALAAGLSLPVITFTEFIVKKSTYTILSGIGDLYGHGEYVLAVVIFIFSVVFPIIKLLSLMLLWFIPFDKNDRHTVISRLGDMGKWSMLDVYVVALTIVIAKSSAFFKAKPEMGLYFFGASAVLSILTSMRIERFSK